MPYIIQNSDALNIQSQAILQQYSQITNLSDGTLAKAVLRALNNTLGSSYTVLTTQAAQVYVSTASGTSLDLLGVMFNCKRGQAMIANAALTQQFYVANGQTFGSLPGISVLNNIIPAGTIVQTPDRSIQYMVASNIPFSNSSTQVTGSIESITAGTAANVGSNTLTSQNLNVPGILTTNIASITNGQGTMSDQDYRYILSQAITAAEAANETAIRLATLSSPNVSSALIIPYNYGVGTASVIVVTSDIVATQSDLDSVTNNINTVTAIGEQVTVRTPIYIGIELYAKLIFQNTTPTTQYANIATQVANNLYTYINNIPVGQNLVVNQILDQILNTSNQIYDIDTIPGDPNAMSIYTWTPSTMYINANGSITTNRIRQLLVGSQYVSTFDTKIIVEQGTIQGYQHASNFVAINITY